MKRSLLFFLLFTIPTMLFAQFNTSYTVSEVYVEMDIGYDTYYAETDSIYLTEFGKVKALYKKARLSDIGYGKYVVQLENINDNFYRIVNTAYVLKISFASSFAFSRFEDCILDIQGFTGSVTKKDNY